MRSDIPSTVTILVKVKKPDGRIYEHYINVPLIIRRGRGFVEIEADEAKIYKSIPEYDPLTDRLVAVCCGEEIPDVAVAALLKVIQEKFGVSPERPVMEIDNPLSPMFEVMYLYRVKPPYVGTAGVDTVYMVVADSREGMKRWLVKWLREAIEDTKLAKEDGIYHGPVPELSEKELERLAERILEKIEEKAGQQERPNLVPA